MTRAIRIVGTVEERFWPKVDKAGPNGCWVWTACGYGGGYGGMNVGGGRMEYAHRIAYQLEVGPIPEGLDLDHLCRNRGCVNPAHLEPVTRRVNLLRGIGAAAIRAAQTHCKRGHMFDAKNTRAHSKYGTRVCRACDAQWKREKRQAA